MITPRRALFTLLAGVACAALIATAYLLNVNNVTPNGFLFAAGKLAWPIATLGPGFVLGYLLISRTALLGAASGAIGFFGAPLIHGQLGANIWAQFYADGLLLAVVPECLSVVLPAAVAALAGEHVRSGLAPNNKLQRKRGAASQSADG